MPRQKKTLAELVQVLDDGTTLYDILVGFGWAQAEKKRHAEKSKKRRELTKKTPASETPAQEIPELSSGQPAK